MIDQRWYLRNPRSGNCQRLPQGFHPSHLQPRQLDRPSLCRDLEEGRCL